MAEVVISIDGDEAIARKFRRFGRVLPQQMRRGLYRMGTLFKSEIIDNLSGRSLNVQTGQLRASVNIQEVNGPQGPGIKIGPNKVYAAIHEFGGEIHARRAPYLRFQVGGRWVSVKSVTIPARPYVKPALDDNLDNALHLFDREVMKPLRTF